MGAPVPRIIPMRISPPPPLIKTEWECEYCNSLNKYDKLKCNNCGAHATAKSKNNLKPPPPPAPPKARIVIE